MKIRSKARGIALAAGGAVVLAGMAIAVPGTAMAATAAPDTIGSGHIELCSNGNYASQLEFGRIGSTETSFTSRVSQGNCTVFAVPGFATLAEGRGFFNTHPNQSFAIGAVVAVNGTTGASVLCRADGTTTDSSFDCTTF